MPWTCTQNVCTPKKKLEGQAGVGDIALRGDDKIVATAGWDHRYATLIHEVGTWLYHLNSFRLQIGAIEVNTVCMYVVSRSMYFSSYKGTVALHVQQGSHLRLPTSQTASNSQIPQRDRMFFHLQ